ncbi:MAG: dephospho-CoA kinase [Erysipelotrichaceae bacterium]|nr:dephospho-CoA kinase [Erysipelotrichaceae bacterium]
MRVAITGCIGSGKSTVLKMLQDMGYPCLSADEINRQLLQKKEVQDHICSILELTTFSIEEMKTKMFQSTEKKKEVEVYLHPLILDHINQHKTTGLQFVEVPLLFECGWQIYFDRTVVCVCDDRVAMERLTQKRNMDLQDAKQRLACQMPSEMKMKLADYVIYNNDSVFILEQLVKKLVIDLNEKME